MKARGLELHVPAAVLYVSDHLTDSGRGVVEDYRSAARCFELLGRRGAPDRVRRLRVEDSICTATWTHVRIVDEEDHDVPAGESGEVVVSNLVNRGTVLLNHRLGDQGSLAREPGCACGRTLPRLATLEGRRDDVLELAGGRHVHSAEVWSLVRGNEELIQYQLVQLAHDRFELRVVATDRAMFDRVATDLVGRPRPLLGASA